MFTFGRYGGKHTDFPMAPAPYKYSGKVADDHHHDPRDNPCGMTWFPLSTRVGSQITVANHVSRPIAPSPTPPGSTKGETQILTRGLRLILFLFL